ncbi:hypothetical protein HYC85_013825 [Camellia sinensis]|uniref:Mediator of RNA polymerase II transcription subunit 13 n=1 Tax=Camellia sinensis TaxID=4442 RepID=A0A7J7H7Z3_CAMSI|nr:hypothetical protein HYC85_013825 [Camellia sinensis]
MHGWPLVCGQQCNFAETKVVGEDKKDQNEVWSAATRASAGIKKAYEDYFRRRYRMRQELFLRILKDIEAYCEYQDDWLKTSASSLQLWEKAPLEPYTLQKPMTYYVVCPDIDPLTTAAADFFSATWHWLVAATSDLMLGYVDFFLGGDEKRADLPPRLQQRFPMSLLFGGDGSYMALFSLHICPSYYLVSISGWSKCLVTFSSPWTFKNKFLFNNELA